MNVTLRTPAMTREQFLDWVERQEEPYEFDGFEPVAMTGGNNRHTRLCRDLAFELLSRLRESGFEVMPEGGITTVGQAIRYPDVVIAPRFEADLDRVVPEPLIVFEVLSPSSSRVDHAVKLREYRAVPSILRYVIVDNTGPELTVYARSEGTLDWTATGFTSGDALELPEVGIKLSVDEIFRGVSFD